MARACARRRYCGALRVASPRPLLMQAFLETFLETRRLPAVLTAVAGRVSRVWARAAPPSFAHACAARRLGMRTMGARSLARAAALVLALMLAVNVSAVASDAAVEKTDLKPGAVDQSACGCGRAT